MSSSTASICINPEALTVRTGDALVLKALALVVGPVLRLSLSCVHVKGHGGLKAAVREVQQRLQDYSHVLRTDVKSFYESMDQSIAASIRVAPPSNSCRR